MSKAGALNPSSQLLAEENALPRFRLTVLGSPEITGGDEPF